MHMQLEAVESQAGFAKLDYWCRLASRRYTNVQYVDHTNLLRGRSHVGGCPAFASILVGCYT